MFIYVLQLEQGKYYVGKTTPHYGVVGGVPLPGWAGISDPLQVRNLGSAQNWNDFSKEIV